MSPNQLLIAFAIIMVIISFNDSEAKTVVATIKDNGCASHIDMPAPKNLQNKDTYVRWGK